MIQSEEVKKENLPSYNEVGSSKYRSIEKDRPKIPKNIKDLHLGNEWTKTLDGNGFLLMDIKENGKILVSKSLCITYIYMQRWAAYYILIYFIVYSIYIYILLTVHSTAF